MTDNDNSDIKGLSQCQSLNYKTWSLQILLEEKVPQIPSFIRFWRSFTVLKYCFQIYLSHICFQIYAFSFNVFVSVDFFESNARKHGPCPVQHECCDEFKVKVF